MQKEFVLCEKCAIIDVLDLEIANWHRGCRKKLIEIAARLIEFSVYSVDYDTRHYCFSYVEALSWARCYHNGDLISIWHFGREVGRISSVKSGLR